MNINILDTRNFGSYQWFLGKISLWDYLSAINEDNFEFDIQRGVVKNKYLDTILSSIEQREPIPPLTITTNCINDNDSKTVRIEKFDILDGLQRTYRLWVYKKITELCVLNPNLFEEPSYDFKETVRKVKEAGFLIPGIISIQQIKNLLNPTDTVNVSTIEKIYKEFDIYIYVWCGLNENAIIKKMLILNAGQRKVSIGHQYELMFLRIFHDKDITKDIKLIREKDAEYGAVKNGNRNTGQFIFSTIVIGLQSLIEGKPMRLTPDYIDDDYISEEITGKFFNQPFLNAYLNELYNLDVKLSVLDENYKKWFVKDTTISGIMGAIGAEIDKSTEDYAMKFKTKLSELSAGLEQNNYFELNSFYTEYDNLSSTKINIGDKVREAVYHYTKAILSGSSIHWKVAFNSRKEE